MLSTRNLWIWSSILAIWILLVVWKLQQQTTRPSGDYYSITERRMPCGNYQRREVIHTADAWIKRVTWLDPTGHVLGTKTRVIEPEHCPKIQNGEFVPGLWHDCKI